MRITYFLVIIIAFLPIFVYADSIYIMHNNYTMNHINILTNLGYQVTNGGTTTLSNYSAYNQVWDLRYDTNLTSTDVTAFNTYLSNGGRLYLGGEQRAFDSSRNNTLIPAIATLGGGTLSGQANILAQVYYPVTMAELKTPAPWTQIKFYNTSSFTSPGTGTFVVETSVGSGVGTIIAWDFGDIQGKSNVRMIAGFDIDIFTAGTTQEIQYMVQNFAAYLGASVPVPEPSCFWILGFCILFYFFKKI